MYAEDPSNSKRCHERHDETLSSGLVRAIYGGTQRSTVFTVGISGLLYVEEKLLPGDDELPCALPRL